MKKEQKLKIPHPKMKKGKKNTNKNSKIPTSIIEAMRNINEADSLKLKKKITQELSINNLLDLPSIFIANTKLKSKSSLMNDLSDIKYINKSIYNQLGKILNEEERIINTDYSKTNNFNFDFEAFEEKKNNKIIKSKSYCNFEDISYLNRYEEIIRDKISNEKKAEQYINEMNNKLQKKILKENEMKNEINNFTKEKDEKKLKITTEIDAKIHILNNLNLRARRSSSSPKCSIKLLNKREQDKNKIINNELKVLKNEISNLKNKQKENDISYQNIENEYNQKSKNLHEEIKQLKNELNEHIKCGIEYYLEILKKGTDTRTNGLSWVVRKLLKLGYKPQLNNFPNYFDNHMIKFLIEYSKKKNENYELVNQLNEYKNNINKELRNDTFVEEKKEIRNSFQHNTENYIENKFGELLERHNSNNYFKKNINLKKCSIFPSLNLTEENKTNEKLNKSFINNKKKNEIQKIVDIKKKVEMNEHLIKKLKDDEYKYVIDKKSKNHNFDKDYKENIMKSLFGVKV
jgi:hypothetical protein